MGLEKKYNHPPPRKHSKKENSDLGQQVERYETTQCAYLRKRRTLSNRFDKHFKGVLCARYTAACLICATCTSNDRAISPCSRYLPSLPGHFMLTSVGPSLAPLVYDEMASTRSAGPLASEAI